MNFTDHFHPPPGARLGRQPGHPGRRPALVQLAAGARLSEDRERHRHDHHQLSGRRPRLGRRLHHDADRDRGRAGERHRLHDLDQPEQHQHDHGVPAAELRHLEGGGRDQHQGQFGAEPAAHRIAAADHHREGRPDHRRDVHGLHQRHARARTRSRTTSARGAAETAGRPKACRPRRFSAARLLPARLARSEEAAGVRHDREPTCRRALSANDYISAVGNTKGQMVQVDADLDHQPAQPEGVSAISS